MVSQTAHLDMIIPEDGSTEIDLPVKLRAQIPKARSDSERPGRHRQLVRETPLVAPPPRRNESHFLRANSPAFALATISDPLESLNHS